MDTKQIQIKLSGENISPNKIRASDLAELVRDTEELAISQVGITHPEINKEEIFLSLVGINEGSVELSFTSSKLDIAIPAFELITDAIKTGNYDLVATHAIEKIKDIRNFTKRIKCSAEILTVNGSATSLVVISPETIVETPPEIQGQTILYGKLIRVGGKKAPTAWLEISDTVTLTCDLGFELAKQLAHRLYSWVGLIGVARWSVVDQAILSFRVNEISKYEDQPISESFQWLRESLGQYFTDVDDPDVYVRKIRAGSE